VSGNLSQYLLWLYSGASVITFIVYAVDKSKAKRGVWRIKESTLHLLALVGGWPGAALAQQMLRHKSHKKKFRIVFWLMVFVNVMSLTCFLTIQRYSFV
jgi:uncharacterized membrane protein YsdA (DUF1294 family)